ncbi:MAG: ATP-dependent nuclease subunit B-like protein [Solirubrobacterales bacterium]|nr:ATP-dependent nuclease subunit B-like protein [Solirubrobacterales bacterium]
MPLKLVTGPANAEKAGVVLDAYRSAIDRDPILVVPTFADVEHYRRELAATGAVFGVEVVRFSRLIGTIAARTGLRGRPLGAVARERVARAAIAGGRLDVLGASAATPGFTAAFLRLADELTAQRVDPGRLFRALRDWGAGDARRAAYAEELAGLYAAYRRALERAGRRDATLHGLAALDALRLAPARWGATPVFFYGFDDFTPLQRDAVETLARHAGADVTVSLSYEPGREAFAGRGETFQELLALAGEHVALEARAEHYAEASRPALHHLERSLFEPLRARVPAGDAVTLLEGGGQRAEIELVAARVAALIAEDGYAPADIAVVLRRVDGDDPVTALVERVFGAYGIPLAVDRRVPARRSAVGRGLVALLRCALLDGTADELLTWLRTPGLLERPALADRLEAEARRDGARTAAEARVLWETAHPTFPLEAVDRVRTAHARGPVALYERLASEAGRLFAAPWRGRAPVLTGPEALEARMAGALRRTLDELGSLARADPALAPTPTELARLLDDTEVPAGDVAGAGAVTVTSPLALRARRVRALFCCGLQEGAFPAPGRPEPFLGDAERRAINAASGLRLRLNEDPLGAERYLFYAALSRPTDLLVLSWHTAAEDGDPVVPSLFVADVRELFGEDLWTRRRQRALGAVGWAAGSAPTERERRRGEVDGGAAVAGEAIAPLRHPAVLAALRERRTWSASGLETWASCPVKWFVERWLRPEQLEPDPEPMIRGALAHAVLEEALRAVVDGGGRLEPARLPEARALLHETLRRRAPEFTISANPQRLRSQLRRLEADLLRYVEHAAHSGTAFTPAHFELTFGGPDDERPAVELAGGELALQGRIDRVDVDASGAQAVVYDYKGRAAPAQARWVADGKLQVGLYMLALRDLLGIDAVGGLYQPLGAADPRPRGLLYDDADPGLDAVRTDRLDADAFARVLDGVERAAARAVAEVRAGALEPRPDSCAWQGGCSFPSICRCEDA